MYNINLKEILSNIIIMNEMWPHTKMITSIYCSNFKQENQINKVTARKYSQAGAKYELEVSLNILKTNEMQLNLKSIKR